MVTPYYYPTIGGTESLIENISLKLNEIGVIVDVMTFNLGRAWRKEIDKVKGINIIRVPAASVHTRLTGKLLAFPNFIPSHNEKLLRDYDIIHFHNDADLSFPLNLYMVNKPKIFHCHLLDRTYGAYKRNFLSRYIFRKAADAYIVLSTPFTKLLVNLGIPETKIIVVPNGINTEVFKPRRDTKIENLLVWVGRVVPKKGLHVLLQSLYYLDGHVKLVIAGPATDRNYFKAILRSIGKANEETNHDVQYVGVQESEELIRLYQKAALFVLPSLSESLPLVIIEALSCETPVVASRVGGIPDVIRDYKNGILVPPNDAIKLAKSIQYLLDNESDRKKFGMTGRRWAIKNFSSKAEAERLAQIYKEMIY